MSGYSELGGGSEKVVDVAVIAKVGDVTTVSEAERGASSAVGGASGGVKDDAGGRDDEVGGVDDESGLVVEGAEPPPVVPLLSEWSPPLWHPASPAGEEAEEEDS